MSALLPACALISHVSANSASRAPFPSQPAARTARQAGCAPRNRAAGQALAARGPRRLRGRAQGLHALSCLSLAVRCSWRTRTRTRRS
jgi:hypothetical protein